MRPGGRIINISSIAAYTGGSRGGVIGYGTAKAGLHGLTCALTRELSPQGITVNTISPGLITETDFFGGNLTQERPEYCVTGAYWTRREAGRHRGNSGLPRIRRGGLHH